VLVLGVVVVSGRRNASSQIIKTSTNMLPSPRSNWFSYIGFMTWLVQSRYDLQRVFAAQVQTRPLRSYSAFQRGALTAPRHYFPWLCVAALCLSFDTFTALKK
jgi:hypothetical protein